MVNSFLLYGFLGKIKVKEYSKLCTARYTATIYFLSLKCIQWWFKTDRNKTKTQGAHI